MDRLSQRFAKDPTDARIADSARLLFGQAVLAGGGQLEDPSGFAELVNRLMAETL
jgi:molecular chaperone HtpG